MVSRRVQEAAFRMGYNWDFGGRCIQHTKEPYLYLWMDGTITYGKLRHVFNNKPHEEIHWQTFINLNKMRTITLENGKKVKISEESYQNLSKATQNTRWKPKRHEYYFTLDSIGGVDKSKWDGDEVDEARWAMGNVYSTEEKAEEAAHAMKMRQKILDRIAELNEGWEPDWRNTYQGKYYIIWYRDEKQFQCAGSLQLQAFPDKYYFRSKEIGHKLIEEFGDNLKYLFK
jgi:hypothetical protein